YRDVVVNELHLARQRDLLGVLVERRTQQAAQSPDGLGHGRLVAFERECRDRIQRVEQEVRVELRTERGEPRFGQTGAQVRVMQRQVHPDDGPVGQHVEI